MWSSLRRPWIVLAVALAALPGLGQKSRRFEPAIDRMELEAIRNGFGQLLPHRVPVPDDDGLPTGEIVEIRRAADLANVRPTNPVLPVATWPAAAVLPNGDPGNHYVAVRFPRPIDVDSVLTGAVS